MQLSVIIVNYNVKYFLEQCLASVQKAVVGMDAEILVVDNASTDGSMQYLPPRFPGVRFIANEKNTGFAKACNQAYSLATGQYILFLNPDTLVPENCFSRCIAFFEETPGCGALGVRMVDGSGRFLKESKRGFPSPLVSFYKLSGLARLFPRSKVFAHYHLGHLSATENHEVDVLAGAFMMVKKEVLEQTGVFDESFFMYGEDIDLSFRIQKAGFKNYYFAGTTILHFKGESTKKGSLNYVKMFYSAMSLFVKKHYGQWRAGIFRAAIQTAIWLRAGVSAAAGFIRRIGLPVIDAGVVLLCIWGVKLFWFAYIRPEVKYVREVLIGAASLYAIIYIITGYLTGLYDKPFKQSNLNRCAITAGFLLLAVYGLLPEHYRFSRGIISISAVLVFLSVSLLRHVMVRMGILESAREADEEKQTVVIASPEEYAYAEQFYTTAGMADKLLGRIDPGNQTGNALG
ncbi:MAG: glycosyltransferase, partial [Dinghuibacter sp.]|nr:glycosyltransferase [Dinghuibacter sp.]